jgi:hypothetical protein
MFPDITQFYIENGVPGPSTPYVRFSYPYIRTYAYMKSAIHALLPTLLLMPRYARARSGVSSPAFSSTGARRTTVLCTTLSCSPCLQRRDRRMIDALYQCCSAPTRIDGCQSMPLAVHCGVAQGCPLSLASADNRSLRDHLRSQNSSA